MYKQRRHALTTLLLENSIALFFSGKAPYKVGGEKHPFSMDRSFYYLSGLDKESMILAVTRTQGKIKEQLFLEYYDEEQAEWVGGELLPEEAADISEIKEVFWLEGAVGMLGLQISRFFDHKSCVDIYADFTRQEAHQMGSGAHRFTRELLRQYPYVALRNAASRINSLCLIKGDAKIDDLKQAIEVTRQGILAMMDHICSDMMENQVEVWFNFVLKINGCSHSFPPVITSEGNAIVLCYDENNQKIKKNSPLLCDLGASCHYVNADITRTFPASGSFTKRQKRICNIVLEANQAVTSFVHPGITLKELDQELIHFYEGKLKPLDLLKRGRRMEDYYWHGVSHMLGLETHDMSLSGYKLRPGNAFTIEPDLYLENEGIGIRIEDNILVTGDGCISLSSSIVKDPDEIRAYMQENNIHLKAQKIEKDSCYGNCAGVYMKHIINEFKELIVRGNMSNLAVGIIIGGAFQKVIASLVSDVIIPVITLCIGDIDFTNWFIALGGNHYNTLQGVVAAKAATLNYGAFLTKVINFIIIAFIIFMTVKMMNSLPRKVKKPQDMKDAAAATKVCPCCENEISAEAVRCPHRISSLNTNKDNRTASIKQ